ncbi:cyclic pyranopterin monophosphate synthase MoaC [Haliea sp.]|jgi:cyclic pyranopterin phosphate synthase|uniref:cyclic pyranopterin monophosphate synthase MoaC n=1 Tax=Haliea TaxID=475794 RepID=UPI000C502424|nr:cyclic pyranopterin monophosphate synthase MoaC [Haliea sp.]HBX73916.1 cyclic pyranopterin monophosphate synthase MoaC [Halieaceae bacterium]MAY91568.1 cyclic pyranopterin monophosphate synthase MoaC [Haliea sp.]MBK40551.1 cyclic pyranopterin monophosphate synthase MoaC [Haliea sp.]MBP68650.1 cyclic pyranopterin monophosphate synthase MoaC [Haliea sp.]HCD54860.1 cyclic pyranopterin monophosphate synthase MoaC [Halieaceae bacterium]|tara:strand:- start:161 stop:655 length:495 start_codon:yes stop_codon:yes gene_type:complete
MSQLTHLDASGTARMVDVGAKPETRREAVATASVSMQPETLRLLREGAHAKGDVLTVARIAGIQGAKKCAELIPLCHPLMLNSIDLDFTLDDDASCVHIAARCRVSGKTGVEMEALTAASVAALTIYDMCKAVDRGMLIQNLGLQEKYGGNSGSWERSPDDAAC